MPLGERSAVPAPRQERVVPSRRDLPPFHTSKRERRGGGQSDIADSPC
jgi:hypothetical protein